MSTKNVLLSSLKLILFFCCCLCELVPSTHHSLPNTNMMLSQWCFAGELELLFIENSGKCCSQPFKGWCSQHCHVKASEVTSEELVWVLVHGCAVQS